MLYGQEHVRSYRETDGEEGHDWQGAPVGLLTTKGRKSGKARTTPLIYGRAGDDYMVVASDGGQDEAPSWYQNIETPDEKPELWKQMTGKWPAYDDYQSKTDRQIPVVILERR